MVTKQILPTTIPTGAEAALFWIGDQLLFQTRKDDAQISKFVSSAAVRQAFVNEPIDSGWLPPNVSRCGQSSRGTWMVRILPPAQYNLRMAGQQRALRVPLPGLVWFGQANHYYIFAMKARECGKPSGEIFHAPLPNVNGFGLICFGQNDHPNVADGGFDKAWRTFWEAPFNDDHSSGKSKQNSNNINDLLRSLARQKMQVYPESDLVSTRYTLDGLIETLTRRGGHDE